MQTVKVISEIGNTAALVEWYDGTALHRVTLPCELVRGDSVDEADLERGIPYGVAWETALQSTATPEAIANELRRCGIWTGDDLAARPTIAAAALQRSIGVNLAALRVAAKEHSGG
jgi:hypothetical protein